MLISLNPGGRASGPFAGEAVRFAGRRTPRWMLLSRLMSHLTNVLGEKSSLPTSVGERVRDVA